MTLRDVIKLVKETCARVLSLETSINNISKGEINYNNTVGF